MSGSSPTVAHVSALTPRSSAGGVVVLAYDPVNDTFAALLPSALQGLKGDTGATGGAGPQGPQGVPGSAGVNGSTVRSSTGAPADTLGVNGDWCIDRQNWLIYGPKANGSWPTPGISLIGPQGAQGPQGPAGAAGTGGGGGSTSNLDAGTADGQVPVWSATASKYQPQTGTPITADGDPTVELNANTALTYLLHNRRNIVISAAANLTLAAAEVTAAPNKSMTFVINNDSTAAITITFGSGLTVNQPSTGTGTGGAVKVAVNGMVAVQCYPKGTGTIAKVRGDVA